MVSLVELSRQALVMWATLPCHVTSLMMLQVPTNEDVNTMAARLQQVLILKHDLELVEPLRKACEQCSSQLPSLFAELLSDDCFDEMRDHLSECLEDSAQPAKGALPGRQQRIYAIKNGINGRHVVSPYLLERKL